MNFFDRDLREIDRDASDSYDQFVETIRTTRDPDAIAVLASLLDSEPELSDAAAEALRYFGPGVQREMRLQLGPRRRRSIRETLELQ